MTPAQSTETTGATFPPELGGSLHGGVHRMPVRVYYEDTDAEGLVYYANYLRFMERGRTEFLRTAGLTDSTALQANGMGYVIRRVEMDYKTPARLDDVLTIRSWIAELRGASMTMHQTVYRGEDIVTRAVVGVACLDLHSGKPVRLPEDIKVFFAAHPVQETSAHKKD